MRNTLRPRLLWPLSLSLALSGLFGTASARADCLASVLKCDDASSTPTASSFSTACKSAVLGFGQATFDVPSSTMHLSADEVFNVEVELKDEFTITGLPAGTPVAVRLRARYYGYVRNSAGGLVALAPLAAQPGDSSSQRTFSNTSGIVTFADSTDLVLQRVAGSPFGLEIHGQIGTLGGSDGDVSVRFAFVDLPPGTNVTSCKGYTQDPPVAAFIRSWGGVKAAYR